jgi:hypothetical protein
VGCAARSRGRRERTGPGVNSSAGEGFPGGSALRYCLALCATGGPRSASSVSVPPEREKTRKLMRSRERQNHRSANVSVSVPRSRKR